MPPANVPGLKPSHFHVLRGVKLPGEEIPVAVELLVPDPWKKKLKEEEEEEEQVCMLLCLDYSVFRTLSSQPSGLDPFLKTILTIS